MNHRNTIHNMRSCFAVLLSFALIITCLSPSVSVYAEEPSGTLRDGVYEGTGEGRNGLIAVSVTVEGGVISVVEVTSQQETPSYWEEASVMLDQYTGRTAADEVDTVTGATLSCEGIRDAVSDALSKASADAEQTISGSGTRNDPYEIRTGAQLQLFADKIDEGDAAFMEAYVVLGSDIDLSGTEWNPIGAEGKASANADKLFAGVFDGRGRTISGMKIAGEFSSESNLGLFSTLAPAARIRNIVVKEADIDVTSPGDLTPLRAGIIAGDTQSQSPRGAVIDGCTVDGTVKVMTNTSSAWGGGILGRGMSGTAVVNCISSADVDASSAGSYNASYAGGIIGQSGSDNVLANSAATGAAAASNDKSGIDSYAGGIAGMLSGKTYNVYSAADAAVTRKDGGSDYAGIAAGLITDSFSGNMIYYSSDASVSVNGEPASSKAYGEIIGTAGTDSFVSMTDAVMKGADFAELLNSNIKSVIDALDESTLEMREWKSEDGRIILSDSVWVPGEVDPGLFESGEGTGDNPYLIRTADQLEAFAGSMNSKIDYSGQYIRLDADIDISGRNWTPAGGSFYRFDGDFDGNGKVITGLSMGTEQEPAELDASSAYVGLFGWVNEHAHIHDLTLDKVAVYTHSTGSAYIGGIAGRMSGSDTEGDYHGANIDGCTVRGTISHTTDKGTSFIGGISGHMFKGTVINSMTDVDLTAKELSGELAEAGGMVGLLNRGLVANSYALGNVTGSGYRDTQYDIEGMACVGNIAAVNGGYIVNCYGQGDVEALEYSIDTGVIAGWVTGIGKVYDCWYNEDASMIIDGRNVSPVDPFGETVAGGVSDEWGYRFPGSLLYNNNGYHPDTDAAKVAEGLNSSFAEFPVDIEGMYGLGSDALRVWTAVDGRIVLGRGSSAVTYVQPDIEKKIEEEPEQKLMDGTWYGRSEDKTAAVRINVRDGAVTETAVLTGESEGDAYNEAVARAEFKARFGDTSDYELADTSMFEGSGSENDPYRIGTEEQLRYLAASVNEDVDWQGKYFLQTGDITVSGNDWTPIGRGIFADADGDGFGQDVVALYPFCGIYDGGGHVIRGLSAGSKESPANVNYMGLFGVIQGSYRNNEIPQDGCRAVLKNIRLEDVSFYTENRWRSYTGGLVANAQGGFTIDNCFVTGVISSRSTEDFAFAGGLAGSLMYGSVTDTGTYVDSSSWSGTNYSYAAGMSATTNRATIVDSYTLGAVHADADQTNRAEAGGFVGLDGGVCINCYAKGDVEIVSKYSMFLGGFAGMAASSSEHRQCYYNTDAIQKVSGKAVETKRYAGKFVNESAEANAQAQSAEAMSSEQFAELLESNRKNLPATLRQVREVLGADENGSSKYHSLYYNGDGSDLRVWVLSDGVAGPTGSMTPAEDGTSGKTDAGGNTAGQEGRTAIVKTVVVNTKTVSKRSIDTAIRKAGGSGRYVSEIVLGSKVRKISKKSFAKYPALTTITVRSKKLTKKSVRGSLRGSKVKTVKIRIGSKKSVNKKYAKKYRKYFTRKNAGKKVSIK